MSVSNHTFIFLANASSDGRRKKDVQSLKILQSQIKESIRLVPDWEGKVVVEGKDKQPYAFELLTNHQATAPIKVLYLTSVTPLGESIYLNSDSGKRRPFEINQLSIDHFSGLQLVVLQGGATLEWIEQLLFVGVPMVLALPQTEGHEIFFQALGEEFLVSEAAEALAEKVGPAFLIQEIPQDPYQYWQIKEKLEASQEQLNGLFYLPSTGLAREVEPVGSSVTSQEGLVDLPSLAQEIYYCSQEEQSSPEKRELTEIRQLETKAILGREKLWDQYFEEEEELIEELGPETEKVIEPVRVDREEKPENLLVDNLVHNYRQTFRTSLPRTYRKGLAAISLAAMVAIMFLISFWQIEHQDQLNAEQLDEVVYGKAFASEKSYNLLLLPFQPYLDCQASDALVEIEVKDQIKALMQEEDMNFKVSYLNPGKCPETIEDAIKWGRENRADIVVWGNYEKVLADPDEISLRYVSLQHPIGGIGTWMEEHIGKQSLGTDLKYGVIEGNFHEICLSLVGLSALGQEKYQLAIRYIKQIELQKEKRYDIFHHILAKSYQGLKLDHYALEAFNEAICLNPQNADVLTERGRLYQRKRAIGLAMHDYEEALLIDPNHGKASLLQKVLEQKNPALDQFASLEEGSRYEEINISPMFNGQYDEESLDSDREESEEPAWAAERRKRNQIRNRQLQNAIEEYTRFIRKNPGESNLYYQRGMAYEMLNQYDYAMADFSYALRLNPGYLDAYVDRGNLYRKIEEFDKALADYNQALRISPEDANIYAVRAELLTQLGRFVSAEMDVRKALDLEPENLRYQRLLGRISAGATSY